MTSRIFLLLYILYFFADDTNVFYSHASCGELVRIINEELLKINDWFLANKLSLNLDKTNYILFKSHGKPAPKENPGIKIQDLLLNQVESTRFLTPVFTWISVLHGKHT